MSGQTRSNYAKFLYSKFSYKTYLSCPVLSRDSENAIYFRTFTNTKTASKKCSHHLYLFIFCHCTDKNKDIALKLGMVVVGMHVYNFYFLFGEKVKIFDFRDIHCFEKSFVFYFRGRNSTISKI